MSYTNCTLSVLQFAHLPWHMAHLKNKRSSALNLPKLSQVCPSLFLQFNMRISVIYDTLSVLCKRDVTVLSPLASNSCGGSHMRSPDPRGEKLHQRRLSSVWRLWSNYTQKREDVGNQFLFPSKEENEEEDLINFHPFQIAMYLTLFVIGFQESFWNSTSCLVLLPAVIIRVF